MEKTDLTYWLLIQQNLGLASNTILAYRNVLNDYSSFCTSQKLLPYKATKEDIALYVKNLLTRPVKSNLSPHIDKYPQHGLSNATIQQRLTVLRLYYDFLIEEGIRSDHPVGRSCWSKGFADERRRGIVQRYRKLPWIPDDVEWNAILKTASTDSLRNRLMLAMAYDAGLR